MTMERVSRQMATIQSTFRRQPILISTIGGSAIALLALAVADYRRFKALGPGGVPYNVLGWLMVTLLLRPLAHSKNGTTNVDDFPSTGASQEVVDLPSREGPRPDVGEIIPQRQLSQNSGRDMRKSLQDLFDKIVEQNTTLLESKLSHYEKHNPAIYVHQSSLSCSHSTLPETASVAQGEIGHIHPDSSFHLYFSPADARVVIEKGWGERHRLARTQPWYFGRKKNLFGVGSSYILLYGPRNQTELGVARVLLNASVKYMTGRSDVKTT